MRTQTMSFLGKVAVVSILVSFLLLSMFASPAGAKQVTEIGTGTGLRAEYFNLDGSPIKVNDQPLIVNGEGPIQHGLDRSCSDQTLYQGICALWAGQFYATHTNSIKEVLTGYIEAPQTGNYRFYGVVDDYVKLTVNGLMTEKNTYLETDYELKDVPLVAGEFYPITIEYKNQQGDAHITLSWALPDNTTIEIVPKKYLYLDLPNTAPAAEAGGPYTIDEGSSLTLNASGSTDPDGNISKYEWDLDNDKTYETEGITAQVTFKKNGTFQVGLKVTDAYGETSTDTAEVIVSNVSPVVDAGLGATVNEGATFARTGSFTDPGEDTWTATIDYGDGGGATPLSLNADKTFALNHVYADNGSYPVQVCVSADGEGVNCASFTVTVSNVAPIVQIASGAAVDATGALTASGSFTDPGADTWTGSVDYGDGSGLQVLALNPDKTFALAHTYTLNGTFTVEVCVTDEDNENGCAQAKAEYMPGNGQPPVADAGGPYFTWEGSKILLSAGKSTDPDNAIVSYEWDFNNDGNYDDAIGKRVRYRASDDGIYTVLVKVTDGTGLSNTGEAVITVKNRRPIISHLSLVRQVRVGVEVEASANFWDAGENDTFVATWIWGDGSTSEGEIYDDCIYGSHTYKRPGFYVVKLRLEDNNGGVSYATRAIYVVRPRDWRHYHNHGEWDDD